MQTLVMSVCLFLILLTGVYFLCQCFITLPRMKDLRNEMHRIVNENAELRAWILQHLPNDTHMNHINAQDNQKNLNEGFCQLSKIAGTANEPK